MSTVSTYSSAESTPSRASAAAMPVHRATTASRAAFHSCAVCAHMPKCLYCPTARGTRRPSMSQMFASSPTSTYRRPSHSAPVHPVLSPFGVPSASASMPMTKPSARAIADITVKTICSVANESTWNAPSSAYHTWVTRRRRTPSGTRNWPPATSHSTARVSIASGSIDRPGALGSPWPLPISDSVPGVSPLPESYETTSASCSAITTSVTSCGTPHRASAARCTRLTTDWKNPPLSQ